MNTRHSEIVPAQWEASSYHTQLPALCRAAISLLFIIIIPFRRRGSLSLALPSGLSLFLRHLCLLLLLLLPLLLLLLLLRLFLLLLGPFLLLLDVRLPGIDQLRNRGSRFRG